jgi:hypothetical protein
MDPERALRQIAFELERGGAQAEPFGTGYRRWLARASPDVGGAEVAAR